MALKRKATGMNKLHTRQFDDIVGYTYEVTS